MERTQLIAPHLTQVPVREQRGDQHDREPGHGELEGQREAQEQDEPDEEREGGPADPSSEVCVQRRRGDLLGEARIVLGQPSFDLLEDALFAVGEWHGLHPGAVPTRLDAGLLTV